MAKDADAVAGRGGVDPARVEAALDEWFANPRWREVYAEGPDVRGYMTRAIAAADAVAAARRGMPGVATSHPVEAEGIAVVEGALFAIVADEPAAAGYLWSHEVPEGVEHLCATIDAPWSVEGAVGGAVRRTDVFRATHPGRGTLVATLARPWEGTAERRREIEVVVRAR